MIDARTCLILGAGASKEYGLPTGGELYDLCCRNETIAGADNKEVATFARRLARAQERSVDFFLEGRRDFDRIGRLSIAAHLVGAERENLLVGRWMKALWHEMLGGCASEQDFRNRNKLSIITFNYDRSVEVFFSKAYRSKWGREVGPSLDWLPIVHVNGSLGPYTAENRVGYGQSSVEQGAQSIKIHLDEIDYETDSRMSDYLRSAERVSFLGFGFHEENLRRLDLLKRCGDIGKVDFRGSATGLPVKERYRVERYFQGLRSGMKIWLAHRSWTATDYMQEWGCQKLHASVMAV